MAITAQRRVVLGVGGAAELAAIAIAYWAVAALSLRFASINPSATPIWPPTGIALALMLLRGYRIWPAILVGAVAANAPVSGWISPALGAGNTAEALVGAWLLRAATGGAEAFRSPLGVGKFTAIVAAVATPISATVGVVALAAGGYAPWSRFGEVWTTWWLGDLAGAVIVAPVLVLWAQSRPRLGVPRLAAAEPALVMALAVAVGAVAFGAGPFIAGPLPFLAIVPLLWSALRCSQRDTATVALILSAAAVWATVAGRGPFTQPTLNDSFLWLVAFVVSAVVPSLALSAALELRDRALASRDERYRLLVENVRDHAIFLLDPAGRITTWNGGAALIFGYDAEAIIGQPAARLCSPDAERTDALDQAAQAGKAEFETPALRRDGSRFWASVVLSAIRDPDGRLIGFTQITRDISDRKDAEAALEQARSQLLQSQKLEALGQLTSGVAHDFNNLLMVVSGQADLLSGEPGEARRRRSVEAIRAAVARGASLTRQLLSFSRRQTLAPEAIDLPRWLAGVEGVLRSSLGETVTLEIDAPAGLWPVRADPNELELAVINLAVNARDAMPGGGRLSIAAANAPGERGDFVSLTLTDTGVGMAPEVLARAFDPFFTTKAVDKGTGLGLSQVHGFALQAGGEVTAASRPGEGCAVTLTLPRAATPVIARRDPPSAPAPAVAGAAVLLVEDNPEVAEVTGALLERLGCRVLREANAVDALARLEGGEPVDIVFSDITMPGPMNGRALAQRIRERTPHLPVVLTSGATAGDADGQPGEAVLTKPFDADMLAAALARALAPTS